MNISFDLNNLTVKAELLKTIAHPIRLCIVRGLLEQGECNVNKMQSCINIPQSTLSQHLAKLRAAGVVKPRREGVEVFYQLENDEVKKVVHALFE